MLQILPIVKYFNWVFTFSGKKKTQNKKVFLTIDSNHSDESDSIFNAKFKNVVDTVPEPTGIAKIISYLKLI